MFNIALCQITMIIAFHFLSRYGWKTKLSAVVTNVDVIQFLVNAVCLAFEEKPAPRSI